MKNVMAIAMVLRLTCATVVKITAMLLTVEMVRSMEMRSATLIVSTTMEMHYLTAIPAVLAVRYITVVMAVWTLVKSAMAIAMVPPFTFCNSCDANCNAEYCGDDTINGDEECDTDCNDNNGNSLSDCDSCSADCKTEYCGDGVVNGDEECDGNCDGSTVHLCNGCDSNCVATFCGDRSINGHEECDGDCIDNSGNELNECDSCSADCKTQYCGDGIVNGEEECDTALMNSDGLLDITVDYCTTYCTWDYGCDNGRLDSDFMCAVAPPPTR